MGGGGSRESQNLELGEGRVLGVPGEGSGLSPSPPVGGAVRFVNPPLPRDGEPRLATMGLRYFSYSPLQGFLLPRVSRHSISHPTSGETEAQPGETCPSYRANSFQNWFQNGQSTLHEPRQPFPIGLTTSYPWSWEPLGTRCSALGGHSSCWPLALTTPLPLLSLGPWRRGAPVRKPRSHISIHSSQVFAERSEDLGGDLPTLLVLWT